MEATRSDHGLEKAASKRLDRWRKIAVEASQQSRRAHLPEISEPVTLPHILQTEADQRYVLDEEPGGLGFAHSLPAARSASDHVLLLVGPEGGWTDEERAAFAHWTRISMGPLILRAETAALAALAIVRSAW